MPLHSMTGFGRAACQAGGVPYSWELKSVNARGLEIRLRLPPGFDQLEGEVRQRARQWLSRGSCFFTLTREDADERPLLRLNENALALVVALAKRLAAEDGIAAATADGILTVPGVLEPAQQALGEEETAGRDEALLAGLDTALAALSEARAEEGGRLGLLLSSLLDAMQSLVDAGAALAEEAPEVLRGRIAEQVRALVAADSGLDPDRLHQEAVLAASRADVREEVDRLRSHIAGARERLAEGGAVGRRLDFLSQEFNREANTLCSKAFDTRLTAVGMELKAVIEQFREQVQNLE